MCLPFIKLLLLGGFIICMLHIIPSDTVVYYVKSTDPPSSYCPGQPCLILEQYFDYRDTYFNRSKVNVTLRFLQGNHTLKSTTHYIEDLSRFEMVGMQPAANIVAHISATVNFTNVSVIHIENLTIQGESCGVFSMVNCASGTSARLLSETLNVTISATTFNGIAMYAKNFCSELHIKIKKSAILNGSSFQFYSRIRMQHNVLYNREWNLTDCNVSNSGLGIFYSYARIMIINTSFVDMYGLDDSLAISCIKMEYSTLSILGNVLFYNASNGPGSLPYLIPSTSNVTISGEVTFASNKQAPIVSYSSTITLRGNISFLNNLGTKGGAIALKPSTLNIAGNASIYFYNNTARETGGAIYATVSRDMNRNCFYQLLDFSNKYNRYNIRLVNNTARNGGDHIYGEYMHSGACFAAPNHDSNQHDSGTLSYLVQSYFIYEPSAGVSLSPVSSDATGVCLCDNSGQSQCAAIYKRYNVSVCPGELFQVPVFAVGADFGTTVGTVYAVFATKDVKLKPISQYTQSISNNKVCSMLNFTIFSQIKLVVFYLAVSDDSLITAERRFLKGMLKQHTSFSEHIHKYTLYTPLLLNITLLPCPPGFTLLGNPPGCDCFPVLTENSVECLFANLSGYHSWNSSLWLNIYGNATIVLTQYCPFNYCITSQRFVNFRDNPDRQCSMNRAGRLCGGCKEGYSLAIGSSHCIHCPNNNHLALILLFMAAGFLLVLFIIAFNLTVTQGMINGLIFYANIVWTYQCILFPKHVDSSLLFTLLRVFIAWLNLDFGIQVCFVRGLNSFWKTWLQYIFPFYIWSIAGVIICCSRYSTRITNLFGNRAVSLLATLFLLSYAKLLRIIVSSIGFTPLEVFRNNESSTLTVWSLDGHYTYCQFPHFMLFITAIAFFTFLWLPYTLLLLLMQWLRRISHFKLLQWIPRFSPVYDAYFAPLKDEHHYWFGVLLIIRGLLLVVFASTYSVYPSVNYLLLLMISALLLCYANYSRVYKTRRVQFTENFFFISLILIGGSEIINQSTKHAILHGSIFITLLSFCGVVIWSAVTQIFFKLGIMNISDKIACKITTQKDNSDVACLWDSLFEETEPLLEVNQTA